MDNLTHRRPLQTVTSDHAKLSVWTVSMNAALDQLAGEVVSLSTTKEDEWDMSGEGETSGP